MPYQTINPFTEKLVKTFPEQTDEQLKTIIGQAHDTFNNTWSKRSLADRKNIMKNVVKLFRERREELAQYITLEMGKLITESRGEVDLSADILEYYADNAEPFLAPERSLYATATRSIRSTPNRTSLSRTPGSVSIAARTLCSSESQADNEPSNRRRAFIQSSSRN